MKKKLCKKCKLFFEQETCPRCHAHDLASSFQGRITVLNSQKSEVAKKAGFNEDGEYAIKCR